MAKLTMRGMGSAEAIASLLTRELESKAISCTIVDSVCRKTDNTTVIVLVFEKYYYRNSSRASLTVVICETGGYATVDAIGSGGGQGVFIRFSWGAEENFVNAVRSSLIGAGFTEGY